MSINESVDQNDNLATTLIHAQTMLVIAVQKFSSPLRTPVLATISRGEHGALSASSRVVVMRGFDSQKRCLTFYTDFRSSKVREINTNSRVSTVFYDPEPRIQIRLSGQCTIHNQDDETAQIWAKLPTQNQALYGAEPGPGATISKSDSYQTVERASERDSVQHFCVIKVNYDKLDWLHLGPDGHSRAIYRWESNGELSSRWVAP